MLNQFPEIRTNRVIDSCFDSSTIQSLVILYCRGGGAEVCNCLTIEVYRQFCDWEVNFFSHALNFGGTTQTSEYYTFSKASQHAYNEDNMVIQYKVR